MTFIIYSSVPFLFLVEKASSSFDIQGWLYNTVTTQSPIIFSRKILSSFYVSQMYMNAQLVFTLALEEQPLTLLVHTTVLVALVTSGMEEQVAMCSQPVSSFFLWQVTWNNLNCNCRSYLFFHLILSQIFSSDFRCFTEDYSSLFFKD